MVTRIQKAIEERAERRAKEIEDIKIEEDIKKMIKELEPILKDIKAIQGEEPIKIKIKELETNLETILKDLKTIQEVLDEKE
jgi:hypothetical protein